MNLGSEADRFDAIDRRLLNDYQRGLPLSPRPFADMATALGIGEAEVIARLEKLTVTGAISRVGPVFRPKRVGTSTLAAMAVPEDRLEEVADLVNGYREVNHNYEREHDYNLWFVLTVEDEHHVSRVIGEISRRTGLDVLDLPMLAEYHIDLGFPLQW
jgi:DNA-binding Lrp family transcriptional regulator